MGEPMVVRGAPGAIDQYLAALEDGASMLVVPRAPYPGRELVIEHFRTLVAGPVLVTNLHDPGTTVTGTGNAGGAAIGFHTSGSTNHPKCVIYSRERVVAHADAIVAAIGLSADTAHVACTPPHFAYGLSIVHSHWRSAIPVRFVAAASPAELSSALAGLAGPLSLYLLPHQASMLLAGDLAPDRLRSLRIAGGRLSAGAAHHLAQRFPDLELVNMFGQAELGPRLALWRGPITDFTEGRIGRPIEGVEFDLGPANDEGRFPLLARTVFAMDHVIAPPYERVQAGPAPGEFVPTGDSAHREPPTGQSAEYVHDGRLDHFANVAGTKVDLQLIAQGIQQRFPVVSVKVSTERSAATGETRPVVQIVPAPDRRISAVEVRRALHEQWRSLVALMDIRVVDHIDVGEAGK